MIFYFSGTGNTRWLARTLGEQLDERVIDIAQHLDGPCTFALRENERVGFCFPVHGWRPPFVVRQFVHRLSLQRHGEHFCYAFATCGDDVGRTFELFAEDLQAIGWQADSVFSLIMPETYLFPLIDTLDAPAVAAQKKAQAQEDFLRLAPHIVHREKGLRLVNESRWPRTNSLLLGAFFLRFWVTDKPFGVAESRCRRCGLCARVCPVQNIRCSEGQMPEWLHNGRCTTCFSCYHHCPAHAITFGTRTAPGTKQYYFEKQA